MTETNNVNQQTKQRKMKMKILSIATLAAALFAASVQQMTAQDVTLGPFAVAGGTPGISNFPVSTISIDCSAQQNIAIDWEFRLSGTDVTNCALRFVGLPIPGRRTTPLQETLADGFYVTTLSGGATNIIYHTNFNVKGYSRLDLVYMTNNSATMTATNWIRYRPKKNAP